LAFVNSKRRKRELRRGLGSQGIDALVCSGGRGNNEETESLKDAGGAVPSEKPLGTAHLLGDVWPSGPAGGKTITVRRVRNWFKKVLRPRERNRKRERVLWRDKTKGAKSWRHANQQEGPLGKGGRGFG